MSITSRAAPSTTIKYLNSTCMHSDTHALAWHGMCEYTHTYTPLKQTNCVRAVGKLTEYYFNRAFSFFRGLPEECLRPTRRLCKRHSDSSIMPLVIMGIVIRRISTDLNARLIPCICVAWDTLYNPIWSCHDARGTPCNCFPLATIASPCLVREAYDVLLRAHPFVQPRLVVNVATLFVVVTYSVL